MKNLKIIYKNKHIYLDKNTSMFVVGNEIVFSDYTIYNDDSFIFESPKQASEMYEIIKLAWKHDYHEVSL